MNISKEVLLLKIKRLLYEIQPPCSKCPYKLGLVQALINPCPQCKANGYQTFKRFQRELVADDRKRKSNNGEEERIRHYEQS